MRKVYRVMLIIFGILSTIGGIGCSDEAKNHYNDGVAKADKKLAEQAGDERLKTSVDRALKLLSR